MEQRTGSGVDRRQAGSRYRRELVFVSARYHFFSFILSLGFLLSGNVYE